MSDRPRNDFKKRGGELMPRELLERAADVVADVCLADPRVERVTVSVRKFGTVLGLGSAEVKITRPL